MNYIYLKVEESTFMRHQTIQGVPLDKIRIFLIEIWQLFINTMY